MSKVEFSPPIPITDFCGFCGNKIPEKQIMTTGITCVDCKRPVCPSCKADVREAGLDGCPYCKTIHLDDSNTGVKRALQEIYEKKLIERKQKIEKQVSGQDAETPWMMTTESFNPVMTTTAWSASSTSQPPMLVGPFSDDDQYPHRPSAYPPQWKGKDPLAEPMDKPKKVTRLSDGEVLMREKPKKVVLDELSSHDKEDNIRVSQRYAIPPQKKSSIAAITSVSDIKEEAQRGTGRSTQRQLTALNHFFDRTTGKYEAGRSVLFVVNNQRMLKEAKRNIQRLYAEEYTRSNIQRGVFDRVMDNIFFWNINLPLKGIHPTLIVIDLVAPITYEQKMNLDGFIGLTPCVGLESVVSEEYKPTLPEPAGMDDFKIRSRKEKPPRTALRCFKCGHKPDECVCDNGLSFWQRFKNWIRRK